MLVGIPNHDEYYWFTSYFVTPIKCKDSVSFFFLFVKPSSKLFSRAIRKDLIVTFLITIFSLVDKHVAFCVRAYIYHKLLNYIYVT